MIFHLSLEDGLLSAPCVKQTRHPRYDKYASRTLKQGVRRKGSEHYVTTLAALKLYQTNRALRGLGLISSGKRRQSTHEAASSKSHHHLRSPPFSEICHLGRTNPCSGVEKNKTPYSPAITNSLWDKSRAGLSYKKGINIENMKRKKYIYGLFRFFLPRLA